MDAIAKLKPNVERFQFGPWTVTATKSHILKSEGSDREKYDGELKLPQLPEMVFPQNCLLLEHAAGFSVDFNALDALRLVDAQHDLMKVAVADAWKDARSDCEHITEVVKPFDWTYSTDYKGTLTGKLKVSPTEERIDLEKLKVREKIHFYADVLLFEDELADNGCSTLSVKIRVMPSSFFVLLRFYLRVDNVLIKVNDTRLYHEGGKPYILREFTSKEKLVKDLQVPLHVLTDQNEITQYLTLREERLEKLEFPEQTDQSESSSEIR